MEFKNQKAPELFLDAQGKQIYRNLEKKKIKDPYTKMSDVFILLDVYTPKYLHLL